VCSLFIILNAYEVGAYEQIKGEQLLWFEELFQKLKEEGGFYRFLIIDVDKNHWKLNVFNIDGELVESEEITYN